MPGFDLNEFTDLSWALNDLYNMQRIYGKTRLDEVIRYVRTKSYRRSESRRDTAQVSSQFNTYSQT